MTGRSPTTALLGLGEAGSAIGNDLLAAGAVVRAYDPAVAAPESMIACGSEADAAAGAAIVLSVNSAKSAIGALRDGLAGMDPAAVWVDMNTASPEVKRELARMATEAGVRFADVALMSPVPGRGVRTPMLASGEGAAPAAELLGSLGANVEVLDGPAGLAASRKLLRSVFFKGLAAAVVEALNAAEAAGLEAWLRENIIAELTAADSSTVDRLVDGTYRHATRRADEMRAAAEMLTDLGVRPDVAGAARDLLERLADGSRSG